MDGELISVHELEARRSTFCLRVPSWSLGAGQVVGLVGPNGAGKTTFLETLAGLRPATSGQVRALGRDPWREPGVRTRLGFMSDDHAVFDLRVDRLLRLISGYYPDWDPDLVDELLDRFEIDPRKHARRLSRGEGTRLRLITAMAFRPRVVVLDEPAAGLDLAGRRRLLQSVLEVVADPSRGVVVSSHVLADIERIADRLLVLHEGRVVVEGPTDDLVGEERTLEEALIAWGAA